MKRKEIFKIIENMEKEENKEIKVFHKRKQQPGYENSSKEKGA